MIQVNPTRYDISASSMAAFKKCPVAFKLGYREGLRLAEDTEGQRVGTNWHKMHEIYHAAWNQTKISVKNEDLPDFALTAVVEHLNKAYAGIPISKTPAEWALERQQLLISFIGYLWYWQNDPIEVLASEVPFELPVYEPKTGMPLPLTEVRRVGKMDHIVRWQGMVGTVERKSTNRSIDPDSDYWEKSQKDSQVSMYALAFKEMGERAEGFGLGLKLPAGSFTSLGNTLYDVFHRPTIKPAMLTQKETVEFVGSQEYYGQKFEVLGNGEPDPTLRITVNGSPTEIEVGKKGIAIRETIGMYGARLLADIQERPGFYFQRREIARTEQDLETFKKSLYAVYQSQKLYAKHNTWFENESQCRATYPCPYIPICYGPGHEAVCDGKTTPVGFRRIFVDLTVNGQEQSE